MTAQSGPSTAPQIPSRKLVNKVVGAISEGWGDLGGPDDAEVRQQYHRAAFAVIDALDYDRLVREHDLLTHGLQHGYSREQYNACAAIYGLTEVEAVDD